MTPIFVRDSNKIESPTILIIVFASGTLKNMAMYGAKKYKRANRIYWIRWVLENPNAQLFKGYNHKTNSYDSLRRVAVCVDNYVVVIELNKKIYILF